MKKLQSLFGVLKKAAFDLLYSVTTRYTYATGLVAYAGEPFSPYQFPSMIDLNNYKVQNPGTVQIVRQSLYDTVLYPTAGVNQINLFVNPQGAGQSVHPSAPAGQVKSVFDTNMVVSGQLPRFQQFVVESIELYFQPGSVATANLFALSPPAAFTAVAASAIVAAANDVNVFYNSGFLKFTVSNGDLLVESPLRKFPPKADIGFDVALASNSATTGVVSLLYGSAKGRPYMLQPLITLQDNAQFTISLNWTNALATPSTFNGQVRCILDGYSIRATQ